MPQVTASNSSLHTSYSLQHHSDGSSKQRRGMAPPLTMDLCSRATKPNVTQPDGTHLYVMSVDTNLIAREQMDGK